MKIGVLKFGKKRKKLGNLGKKWKMIDCVFASLTKDKRKRA